MRAPRRRRQAGFTLIELMISLVLFSLVIAGVLAVAVAMAAGFREQKVTIGAESAARTVMEFFAEAVRNASPGVPKGAETTTVGVPSGTISDLQDGSGTCPRGALQIINSSTGPDALKLIFAYGSVSTATREVIDDGSGGQTIDVVDAREFSVGDLILVTNYAQGHVMKLSAVDTAGGTVTLAAFSCSAGTFSYPANAVVIRVAHAHFTIADLDGIPTLWMDPDDLGSQNREPMAEGIEDLQIEIGIDSNGDGQLSRIGVSANDDEWIHNVAGEVVPAGSARALKISLLARAVGKLTGTGTVLPPILGDRAAWGTADNFRRRVLTTTVEVRNIEGSK